METRRAHLSTFVSMRGADESTQVSTMCRGTHFCTEDALSSLYAYNDFVKSGYCCTILQEETLPSVCTLFTSEPSPLLVSKKLLQDYKTGHTWPELKPDFKLPRPDAFSDKVIWPPCRTRENETKILDLSNSTRGKTPFIRKSCSLEYFR